MAHPIEKRSPSIGIELHSSNVQNALLSSKFDHFQISIPGSISYQKALELKNRNLNLLLHSNILNVFGENDWTTLEVLASRISELAPRQVIEHFTLLADSTLKKFGVLKGDSIDVDAKILAVTNVMRWRSLVNCELGIENAPTTENALTYFQALQFVVETCKVEFVCDLSHLLLSLTSSTVDERKKIIEIVTNLSPKHVHLSGVKIASGTIDDNHHSIDISTWFWAETFLKNIDLITIEQSPNFAMDRLFNVLKFLKLNDKSTNRSSKINYSALNYKVPSCDQINNRLTKNSLSSISKKITAANSTDISLNFDSPLNGLNLFNKFSPFCYPLDSLILNAQQLTDTELLMAASVIGKWAYTLGTWFGLNQVIALALNDPANQIQLYDLVNNAQIENTFPITNNKFEVRNSNTTIALAILNQKEAV